MPAPRTSVRRRALSVVVLASLAVAGCGADASGGGGLPPDQQVRAVVARFGIATRDKDYQEICDRLLADALVNKIEGVGLPCESALQRGLGDVREPTLKINQVSISGARALVSIHTTAAGQPASDDALQLVRQDGEWRIAALASPSAPQSPTGTQTGTTATSTTQTSTTQTSPGQSSKKSKTTKNGK